MADIPVRVIINAINNASKEFKTMSNDAGRFTSDINKVAVAGAALGATAGLLTREFINQAGAMEQNQVAFRTMIGNAETANTLLANIREFAKQTPFNLTELVEGSKRLLAYNVEAKDLIPTLGVLGDITAGVGRDKLPQLILAFGQVKAATKLTGAELRQFSEAGVPLLDTLAKQFGVTASEIQDMVSDGKIGFKDVEKALTTLTAEGGKFHNLMQDQSKTTAGKISNMEDSFQQLEVTLGKALLPTVNRLLEAVIPMVEKFGQWAEKNPDLIVSLTGVAAGVGAVSSAILVLQPIVKVLGATFSILGTVMGLASAAGVALLEAIFAIGAFLVATPIAVVILAIVAAVAALAIAWKAGWLDVQGILTQASIFISLAIENIKTFLIGLAEFIITLPEVFTAFVEQLKMSIYLFFTETLPFAIGFLVGRMELFVSQDVPNFITATIAWFQQLPPRIGAFLTALRDDLIKKFNEARDNALKITKEIVDKVSEFFSTLPGKISDWLSSLPGIISSWFNEAKNRAVQIAQDMYNGVKEWFDKIIGFFGEIISKAGEAISKAREAFNVGRATGNNRQFGGPVSAATSYTVGEVGPEGFTPQVAGHITPSGQYAPVREKSGGGNTIQFIINADMIVNSPLERRSFAEAIYKDLVVLARSQNTSVAELFGA